jgi:hypothetical protein
MSCEGFKDQMLALFFLRSKQVDIRTVWLVCQILCFKPTNRGNRELKRLVCSVNYDIKGVHSNRGKGKRRGSET